MARDNQIQDLVTAFGEFRQEMGQHVGELKKGQQTLETSLGELKTNLREKFKENDAIIAKHNDQLNEAKGSLNTWKWIIGTGATAGLGSLFIEGLKWLHIKK